MQDSKHVLIIDSDIDSRELYKQYLFASKRHFFQFSEADTPAQGLDYCRMYTPDYVFLKSVDQDKAVFEFIEQFNQEDLPGTIIFLTNENAAIAAPDAIEAGANDFLYCDNLSADYLQHRINQLIERDSLASQVKEQAGVIDDLTNHDPLTKLPNRAFFERSLLTAVAQAARHKRIMAILLLDLDNFKTINDGLDHHFGDHVLIEVSKRLIKMTREADTVVRFGGDEFGIILPEMQEVYNAGMVAKKILAEINKPMVINEKEITISASIGIATFPAAAEDATNLIKNADAAMHRAKHEGRNNYQFYQADIHDAYMQRVILENAMFFALERKELFLLYQPKLDLRSGKITGVEVFLRWQHPEFGLVPTDKFIPIAEQTGLIVPIGNWILATACEEFASWRPQLGDDARLAINLSAQQLENPQLPQIVEHMLTRNQLQPQNLELEFAETVLFNRSDGADEVLTKLHQMGVYIAIDDFGTGFSVLNRLKRIPFDIIKIDNDFISDIGEDEKNSCIVKAVIALANSLEVNVVAEGVETEVQKEFLLQNACTHAQGYYFSKPLAAGDVADKLDTYTPD